jgi:hypothetical protein
MNINARIDNSTIFVFMNIIEVNCFYFFPLLKNNLKEKILIHL